MNNLITAAQKDAVLHTLSELANDDREVSCEFDKFERMISFGQFSQIIKQFERLGLIELYHLYREDIHLLVRAEYDQIIQRGGFYGQEVLFKESVEKLLPELETIKPFIPEQTEKILSVIGNFSNFLALLEPTSLSMFIFKNSTV